MNDLKSIPFNVIKVDARRIQQRGGEALGHRIIRGSIIAWPQVGQRLVIYPEDCLVVIVTSPIVRVLLSADGPTLYVETKNSTYHVELSGPDV